MSGRSQMAVFGGTILMKQTAEGYAPFYRETAVSYYTALHAKGRDGVPLFPEEQRVPLVAALLEEGHDAYPMLYQAIANRQGTLQIANIPQKDELGYSEAKDVATEFGHWLLEQMGFTRSFKQIGFLPIDSIDFDIEKHHKNAAGESGRPFPSGLLLAMQYVIDEGNVPVCVGGTGSLTYYATLVHEELQLDEDHHLPEESGKPPRNRHLPVLFLSSMHAFGTKPEHVYRLMQFVDACADRAVTQGIEGGQVIVPHDEAPGSVSLLPLAGKVEKISGQLTAAFMSDETGLAIHHRSTIRGHYTDEGYPHSEGVPRFTRYFPESEPLPTHKVKATTEEKAEVTRQINGLLNERAAMTRYQSAFTRNVSPPLETGNSLNDINHYLTSILEKNRTQAEGKGSGFDTVMICGIPDLAIPASQRTAQRELMASLITALMKEGVEVMFVNDHKMEQQVTPESSPKAHPCCQDFTTHRNRDVFEKAGGIFLDDTTWVKAHIQASLGREEEGRNVPVHFTEARQMARENAAEYGDITRAEMFLKNRDFTRPPVALAMKLIPDQAGYLEALRTCLSAGIQEVVSVNYTDGAMPEAYAKLLQREEFSDLRLTATFARAGDTFRENGQDFTETATLSTYAAAAKAAETGRMTPGGTQSPDAILKQKQQQKDVGLGR